MVSSVHHLTSILRFGHFARECREEENLCYKCHKSGHIAKDCSQPDLCYVCNKVKLGKGKVFLFFFAGWSYGEGLPGREHQDMLQVW